MGRDERDEMDQQNKTRPFEHVDQVEIERRLRKIEASLEWMSKSDNIFAEELDELMDKVDALDSEVQHLMAKDQAPMKRCHVYTVPSRQQGKSWLYERYMEAKRAEHHQPDSDGWIPHDGGERPVDAYTVVEVKFRDNDVMKCSRTSHAAFFVWMHTGDASDIIAYRPAKQEAEWPKQGDEFWFIDVHGNVGEGLCLMGGADFSDYILGIYPTREAAEEAAGKIKRVMDHLREGHEVDLAKWQHNGSARIKKDTIKL